MRRFRGSLIILLVVLIVAMPGCAVNDNPTEAKGDGEYQAVTTTLVGGSPSGVWFMLSTAVAESLGKSFEGSIMHATPGNNYSNLFRMNDFETEFGLTHSNLAYDAVNGIGAFDEKVDGIGAVASFYPSVMQVAFKKEIGIVSFMDIIEDKIPVRMSIGSEGGVAHNTLIKLLQAFGLTIEDMEDWGCKIYFAGNKDSAELFADGMIDGMWKVASAPTPTMTQTGTNEEMVFVEFGDEILAHLINNCGYSPFTIPAGTYKFGTADVESVTTFTILAASLETPEDTVYMITRSICENLDYISTVHSSLEGLTAAELIANTGIGLHPGAEKYYKEIGLID